MLFTQVFLVEFTRSKRQMSIFWTLQISIEHSRATTSSDFHFLAVDYAVPQTLVRHQELHHTLDSRLLSRKDFTPAPNAPLLFCPGVQFLPC